MGSLTFALFAFVLVAGASALWFRRIVAVEIPRNRTGFVVVWALGIVLAVMAFAQGAGWLAGLLCGLAILGGVFFCFTVSVSRQQVADDAVRVGGSLPAFRALDDSGANFDSRVLAGKPTLLSRLRRGAASTA